MNQVQRLSVMVGISAIIGAPLANAAESISLHRQPLESMQHFFNAATPDFTKFAIGSDSPKFKVLSAREDKRHIQHKRMQQYYLDFPVFGAQAIIHSPNTKNARTASTGRVSGMIYSDLESDLGQPLSDFIAKGKPALAQYKSKYNAHDISNEEVTPLVYVDSNNKAFWAYKVSFLVQYNDGIPKRPTAIIDAKTLKSFEQWDNIKSERVSAKARGFGGNHAIGPYTYGEHYPLLSVLRDKSQEQCYLENARVKVVDMEHKRSPRRPSANTIPKNAMQFTCAETSKLEDGSFWTGNNGYDEANGAFSPSNDALFFGDKIFFMYKKWYGENVLTRKDKPMKLVMRVHYGMGYENAFWDGSQMTFGDGASTFHPMVNLGITAHEISHGFTEQHSGLSYRGQSGGIDESFSDMASQAAEAYVNGEPSWKIGVGIFKSNFDGGVLRYMDTPSMDGHSINHASQYYDGMNPHHSSGVYNRLFYLLSTQSGWDVRKAFHVMMTANMDYWTPVINFNSGSCGILYAAEDLEYSTNDVKAALDDVGISYQSCNNSPVNF